jgi:hypothetical protein
MGHFLQILRQFGHGGVFATDHQPHVGLFAPPVSHRSIFLATTVCLTLKSTCIISDFRTWSQPELIARPAWRDRKSKE